MVASGFKLYRDGGGAALAQAPGKRSSNGARRRPGGPELERAGDPEGRSRSALNAAAGEGVYKASQTLLGEYIYPRL
jgi:hypothetical protein